LVVDGNGWVFLGVAGVQRSQDGGMTWTTLSNGLDKGPTGVYEQVDTIAFDPNMAGTIYTIQNEAMYRSGDSGQTWNRLPVGGVIGDPFPITGFYGLALPVSRPGRMFASSWHEMLRSEDAGATWRLLEQALYRARYVADPYRPDTLFAFDGWAGTPSFVMTHDSGDTWVMLTTPTNSKAGVILDLIRPATLFAPGNVRTLPVALQFDSTISRTTYAAFLDMDIPTAVAIDPSGALYWLSQGSTQDVVVTKLPAIHTQDSVRRASF
jgi:hypothetical protein